MKDPITTPGRTYAVTSPNGCTVTTEDGLTLAEVEAGKQGYFVAVSGKVLLSDEAAVLTQLFKLAPQQRLAILGVLGGNDGLPAGYKRVEYLESPGENRESPYIMLGREFNNVTKYEMVATAENLGRQCQFFGAWDLNNSIACVRFTFNAAPNTMIHVGTQRFEVAEYKFGDKVTFVLDMPTRNIKINDRESTVSEANVDGAIAGLVGKTYAIFAVNYIRDAVLGGMYSRIFSYKETQGDKMLVNLVPCLDETGAPCMYDTVSKQTFYNQGAYDFTYPTETTTYSLRRVIPDWGKLTERGLRRLYHAPASWQGELYDYALENGYKPIIEPEQPTEGYWAPRWTETADEIVLEWVETEPPMDESLTETE